MSYVTHDTFRIKRVLQKRPEQAFAAFSDEAKKRRWFAESADHVVERFDLSFEVGGIERLVYTFRAGTQFAGQRIVSEGCHLDIEKDSRIVIASTMAFGERRISASMATFEFSPADTGTLLVFTHQGVFFPGSDGPNGRQHGWTVLLDRLGEQPQ